MAGIKFNNFITSKICYERNPKFYKGERLNISPSYRCEITENNLEATVKLSAVIDSRKDIEVPFFIDVEVIGFFEYIVEESENIEFEDYLTTSAIAILFPYLRSIIADVTARSNEFPVLNLPVANISKMLVEQDAINYIRVSKK
ncbi:MAG: protein-export chaperone SecB [Trichococcus flocculiformis]